jgi:hypothetical protein
LNCSNSECGYSGSAQNVIQTFQGSIDLSRVVTSFVVEEKTRGIREFRDSMSPMWDEPAVRLQPTQSRKCPFCRSSNLRIICNEEECVECGAHVD